MSRDNEPLLDWVTSHHAREVAETLFRPVLEGTTDRIVDNLVELRRRVGLSQGSLANLLQAMGLDHWRQTTVSRVESRQQELSARDLIGLGGIFGSPLFEGTVLTWGETRLLDTDPAHSGRRSRRQIEAAAVLMNQIKLQRDALYTALAETKRRAERADMEFEEAQARYEDLLRMADEADESDGEHREAP